MGEARFGLYVEAIQEAKMSESNGNERIKGIRTRDELFEPIVVIMPGITAVATAWSSWQESSWL